MNKAFEFKLSRKEYNDLDKIHYVKLFSSYDKEEIVINDRDNKELYKKACGLIDGKTYEVFSSEYGHVCDFEEIENKMETEKSARGIIGYEEMWNRAVGLKRINTIDNIIDNYSTQDEKDAVSLALAKEILPFFERDFPGNNKLREAIKAAEEENENENGNK